MKSRCTIAMITVGGLLGLGLVAFVAHGVHEGIANAQRTSSADSTRSPALVDAEAVPAHPVPANVAPRISNNIQYPAVEAPRAATTPHAQRGGFDSYNSQPPSHPSVSSPQPIVIAIKDGPQLSGDTVNLAAFQFKTIFGMVSIPVDAIAGLRMADEPRQPATICLINGDSLTGTLVTDSVTIKTAWGGATIARDQIVSIVTTTEPVTWQPHEGRWKIVAAAPTSSETEANAERGTDDRGDDDEPPQFNPFATPATSAASPLQLDTDSAIISED